MASYNWLETLNVTEEMLLNTDNRLPVIWISALDCTGCKEAFTRSFEPATLDTILNCLFKTGCKGPTAFNACESIGFDRCIAAGFSCIGCSEKGFWDKGGFCGKRKK